MNGSMECRRLNRCVRKLDRNKWSAYDAALSFRYGRLTPYDMVALLQTRHGPPIWCQIRDVFAAIPPKEVFVPDQLLANLWRPNMPRDPLLLTLAYSTGSPFYCRFGHAHTLTCKLPLLCRAADIGSGYRQSLAFEHVQRHIRCTVLLCGMMRFRKSTVLSQMGRGVVSMIAKDIWDLQFHSREAFARHEEIGSWWEDASTAVFMAFVVCGCALSIWAHFVLAKMNTQEVYLP